MKNWNLELIYKTKNDCDKDFEQLKKDLELLKNLKGKLNDKENLKKYLGLRNESLLRLYKVYDYYYLMHDLNQKDTESSREFGKVVNFYTTFYEGISYFNPEMISLGETRVKELLASDSFFKDYEFNIINLFRMNKHILDSDKEAILASYYLPLGNYSNLYDALSVVDSKSKDVTLTDGTVITVNKANFRKYLGELSNQEDRRIVFEGVYQYFEEHKATYAGIYNGIMQGELADTKSRNYNNILESHLYYNDIDNDVFLSLISVAKETSDKVKRYYDIRKKYFKLDTLHTYDRFLEFTKSSEKYDYESAKKMVLEACSALGKDYLSKAETALADGRVSVYPADGKATGAYSAGLYEEGPFILLNHTDDLDSAFTIAHECGHSIHTQYSNETQPFDTANYELFVAEVASTFNEHLFLDYIESKITSKNERIAVLQKAIDNIVSTFYRQALFADYEYQAHTLVEQGESITWETLSGIMKKLYMEYYGIDLNKEPYKEFVWAYVPHLFQSPFYVYMYATSFSASLAIYSKVKNKEPGAFENYINMLKSGGSDFPVNLIKKGGIDLTKKSAFYAVSERLNELLDKLEAELK